jgi:hypothetical protein
MSCATFETVKSVDSALFKKGRRTSEWMLTKVLVYMFCKFTLRACIAKSVPFECFLELEVMNIFFCLIFIPFQ